MPAAKRATGKQYRPVDPLVGQTDSACSGRRRFRVTGAKFCRGLKSLEPRRTPRQFVGCIKGLDSARFPFQQAVRKWFPLFHDHARLETFRIYWRGERLYGPRTVWEDVG